MAEDNSRKKGTFTDEQFNQEKNKVIELIAALDGFENFKAQHLDDYNRLVALREIKTPFYTNGQVGQINSYYNDLRNRIAQERGEAPPPPVSGPSGPDPTGGAMETDNVTTPPPQPQSQPDIKREPGVGVGGVGDVRPTTESSYAARNTKDMYIDPIHGPPVDGQMSGWNDSHAQSLVRIGKKNSPRYVTMIGEGESKTYRITKICYKPENMVEGVYAVNFGQTQIGEHPDKQYVCTAENYLGTYAVAWNPETRNVLEEMHCHDPWEREDRYPAASCLVNWRVEGKIIRSWETRTTVRRVKTHDSADEVIWARLSEQEERYDKYCGGSGARETPMPEVDYVALEARARERAAQAGRPFGQRYVTPEAEARNYDHPGYERSRAGDAFRKRRGLRSRL